LAENGSNESSKLLLTTTFELVSNALQVSSAKETTVETAPQGSVVLFSFLGVILFSFLGVILFSLLGVVLFSLLGIVLCSLLRGRVPPPKASSTDAVKGSCSFLNGSPPRN
jgi:hypothetical protein